MQQSSPTRSPLRTTRSRQLHEAALQVLPGGTSRTVHQTQPHPIYASEGAGAVVTDVDGNRYLDFYNNATSLIHGHAHPAIVAAIEAQARRGTAFSLPVEGQIELAELLTDRIPSAEQVRFVNSGTEAVLLAVKVARAITGRDGIAKFEGLYHGSSDAVEVSLEPSPDAWGESLAPSSVAYVGPPTSALLDAVVVLPYNDLDATEAILRAHADRLAAVVVDVLPMRLGFIAADRDWIGHVRRLTRELGILLVSDEVVTFRLGIGGAQPVYGFEADLTTLGKTIGGGLPVGAIAGTRDAMRAFDGSRSRPAVPNAGTFNANPLTLAAGIAALTMLPGEEVERINALGHDLRGRAGRVFGRFGVAAHVTGTGSLFALHMTGERFTDYRGFWNARVADTSARTRQLSLYDALRERGVLFSVGGVGAISTAMSDREIDAFEEALIDSVEEMQREGLWSD
jgi:glutamate-1-semialdehyde 2,1-aminomutase